MSKLLIPAFIFLIVFGQSFVIANPLAIDPRRRPITMIAEVVEINVRPTTSLVQSTYTFRQGKDDWPEDKDTHITLYVPVLANTKSKDAPEAPHVVVNSQRIPEYHHNDIQSADFPELSTKDLPRHWEVKVYEYRIPLGLVKSTFTIHLSYPQSNFPGNSVGYIPVHPPEDPTRAKVTFRTAPGTSLKPYQARSFYHPSYDTLSYTPEHDKHLRVQYHPKPAQQ